MTTPEFKKGKKLSEKKYAKGKRRKIRAFNKGVNKAFKYSDAYYVMDVEEVIPPTQRKYNEAKGLVTAAYQNEIQAKWITELREKSKITINTNVLYSAKKYK